MELIKHTSWRSLADYDYDGPSHKFPQSSCVVHVHHDWIAEFFYECEQHLNLKFVLISSNSDYGVVEQHKHPVHKDLIKWLNFIEVTEKQGYSGLYIPPRCQTENCLWRDKYSVKMYSWTKATFPRIPTNILHWFSTNNDLDDSRITQIPFGISESTAPLLENVKWRSEKLIDVYVNFQVNTNERLQIQKYFEGISNAKVVKTPVSHAEYVEDLLNSRIVISCSGNGVDTYRVLEALYCGSVPVIPSTERWTAAYDGLPVIRTQNLSNFSAPVFSPQDLINSRADLNFWRDRIDQTRKLLD